MHTPTQERPVSALPVFSLILILLWFIPDFIRSPLVFPFQTVAEVRGAALLAMVTPPVAGALLLLLFAIKYPIRPLRAASSVIALLAATIIIFFGNPTLVPSPAGCATGAALMLGCAVALLVRFNSKKLFFLFSAAPPAALWAYALHGLFSGAFPPAYLLVHKLPISLFAALSACGISIAGLINKQQKIASL